MRRLLKWSGLGVSVLIMVAWAVSFFWIMVVAALVQRHEIGLVLANGSVCAVFGPADRSTPFRLERNRGQGQVLVWPLRLNLMGARCLFVPFWIPLFSVAIPTGILFWHDRRRVRPGTCYCGCDLTGNTSGTCPECGEKVKPPSDEAVDRAAGGGGRM